MFRQNKLFSMIKTKGCSLRLFSRNKKCSSELQANSLYKTSTKSDKTYGQNIWTKHIDKTYGQNIWTKHMDNMDINTLRIKLCTMSFINP